jgi:hypothetical protein
MIRDGKCKHGHVLAETGWTRDGKCAECARQASRRKYARRRGYVRGPYKGRAREEAAQ